MTAVSLKGQHVPALDVKTVAVEALKFGKQKVLGTQNTFGYLVGTCSCVGNQNGRCAWFAYDAGQIVGVTQAFVAHLIRWHAKEDANDSTNK